MNSFVIKIAIKFNRAVVDDITTPLVGLKIVKVEVATVEVDPFRISETINKIFFF